MWTLENLTNECGNEEIARLLYCIREIDYGYLRWFHFNEFKNIEYLAKGDFGEVHKAIWVSFLGLDNETIVLKRIYNSSDKIPDILKEVKSLIYSSNEIQCNVNE